MTVTEAGVEPKNPARVYLESIDSVRFSGSSQDDPKLVYPTMEIILSVLNGKRIYVPEPYSFDSCAFLAIADKALFARQENAKIRNEYNPYWNPFRLTLRQNIAGHTDYLNMAREYFSRSNDKVVLSAWKDHPDVDERVGLLDKLKTKAGYQSLEAANDYRLRGLYQLKNYFEETGCEFCEKRSRNLSDFYGIVKQPEFLRQFSGESTYVDSFLKTLNTLESHEIVLTNRSQVRIQGKDWVDEKELQLYIEFIDTCYNMILSDFSACNQPSFCTNTSVEDGHPMAGESLAYQVNELVNPAMQGVSRPSSMSIEKGDHYQQLARSLNSEKMWETVWDILSGEDWLNKRYELNDMEARNLQETDAYLKKSEDFTNLIASGLTDISIPHEKKRKSLSFAFDHLNFGVNLVFTLMELGESIVVASGSMPQTYLPFLALAADYSIQNQTENFIAYYKTKTIEAIKKKEPTFGLVQTIMKQGK